MRKVEIIIVLLIVACVVLLVFSSSSRDNLYQECINSGKHDKFECYEMIKGE